SKFFPNVATYLALQKFGIDRPELKSGLESNVSREVQRLYALQNQDGGWGWWLGDTSNPTLTGYALLGLYNARQAGFAVDADVMKRAQQFLTRYFDKQLDVKQPYTFNERAFVIFVLMEMGENYTSRAVMLFDQRANLANYGKAYLLMAMQKRNLPQAQTLQAELTSAAIQSATGAHWEEAKVDYWTMNTNTRSTALAIMALARGTGKGEATSPLQANAVRWLMVARKQGHWETTQETAWSVLALTEFMQATGELQGNYSYNVSFNGKQIGDGKVDKTNVEQSKTLTVAIKDMVTNAANDLVVNRAAGDGRLYYSAYLNYYLPVENMSALNKGIIVARQYQAVDPQTLKPTAKVIQSAKVGDYVQVTLTIIAPNDLHYLVLEDMLPAGFEAVDTTLKTSSVAAQSPQLQKQETKQVDWWLRPYWYYWAHSEIRDDRVAAFATYLGRGTYEYSYMLRASVTGEFRTLPARAWEMYFPEVFGRSAGATFTVGQ
ncbi:MAG: alpha-2-macroglobulin, partial [Chloroflexi bacterium]|nr:alpha-2-macroglobulin [Chloroflexota bacterium]